MSRTDALKIYLENGTTEAKLREIYEDVLGNVEKQAVSIALRNQNLSGDPQAGSVEVKRFVNAEVEDYDSADEKNLKTKPVTIPVDTAKRVREKFNEWDLDQYGIAGLIGLRTDNYTRSMVRFLDRAFFTLAIAEGTEYTHSKTDCIDIFEGMVQDIETTENDFVDGVDRDMISVSLKPHVWGALLNEIHTYPNPAGGGVQIGTLNGVTVYSNHRQSQDGVAMVNGAIALPVAIKGAKIQEVPGSVDFWAGLYFKYGIKDLMPELINYATFTGCVSA